MTKEELTYALGAIIDQLECVTSHIEESDTYYPRGTILKADADQDRFNSKSLWVSLGDGTYRHLNGKKGLVTTHDRLDGYTSVVFSA